MSRPPKNEVSDITRWRSLEEAVERFNELSRNNDTDFIPVIIMKVNATVEDEQEDRPGLGLVNIKSGNT